MHDFGVLWVSENELRSYSALVGIFGVLHFEADHLMGAYALNLLSTSTNLSLLKASPAQPVGDG